MSTPVYLSQLPDYFPVVFDRDSWAEVMDFLENSPGNRVLCLSENGLSTAGKIYVFWQKIKAFLGFQDLTDEVKVGAFLARFMFQGALREYLPQHEIQLRSLQAKIFSNQIKVHEAVKEFFNFNELSALNEKGLQQKLASYISKHSLRLTPSFFNTLCSEILALPSTAEFGDTHLLLAENKIRALHFDQALEHYKTAAYLCHLQNVEYTRKLVTLVNDVITSRGPIYPQEIGAIELLLAERLYNTALYQEANDLFKRASGRKASFTEKQKVFYLNSSLKLSQYGDGENRAASINISKETEAVKKVYIETMIQLGDHLAAKIGTVRTRVYKVLTLGTTPSSTDHAQKAAKFYERGLSAAEPFPSLFTLYHSLLRKKLAIEHHLPAAEFSEPNCLTPADQLKRIYLDLTAMKRLNPLNMLDLPEEHQRIGILTNHIREFYLHHGPDQCLDPIEQALNLIGNVKERFQIKYEKKKRHSIICSTQNLVDKDNHFTCEVGSGLHFLRAEVLRHKKGNIQDILEEYTQAVNLAPGNPFGADALFMEDTPPSVLDPLNSLENQADIYRNPAITWNSPQLAAFAT